jgi:DNA-binding transcriptional ArsR family regulator
MARVRSWNWSAVQWGWCRSTGCAPKDAEAAIKTLGQFSAAEVLPALALCPGDPPQYVALLKQVAERQVWNQKDLQALMRLDDPLNRVNSPSEAEGMLNGWAKAQQIGEGLAEALEAYYEVFFEEEQRRIQPQLEKALEQAQAEAENTPLPELLENLSRGIRLDDVYENARLLLVPSFWVTPLVLVDCIAPDEFVLMFGARPADESLVPGERVPDDLLLAFKGLADPTRLRILHYLMDEQLTPAQLSRRLRLRPPTVTHHLHTLRLAGLVRYVSKERGLERLYTVRPEAFQSVVRRLKRFLEG